MVRGALRRLLSGALGASVSPETSQPSRAGRVTTGGPGPADATEAGSGEPLDVCLLSYRSDPYSGGQGVYVKYLSRALTDLGHSVDVVSGKPYPDLDEDVRLVKLPGENVVDDLDRLGQFEPSYLADPTALYEWLSALTGGFPDPYAFGRRVLEHFEVRDPDYDLVHDNQSLCHALPELERRGYPVVATVHHPITVDREVTLAEADGLRERLLVRRWYRFLRMQRAVVPQLSHIVTVSEAARRRTVADFGADPGAVRVVHNGIDTDVFEPRTVGGERDRAAEYRLMTTVSADAPIKGVRYLLRAFAQVRESVDAELVVVGEFNEGGDAERLVEDLGVGDAITTHSGISTDRLVELYASADVAVVPSVYEGFGLPAGEAMACGVPVVATDGG
ncbi:MAG: glycosyltransferase family 4 protein, partial [Haloarculaceae archaeon]